MSVSGLSYAAGAPEQSPRGDEPPLRFPLAVIAVTVVAFCVLLFLVPPTLERLFALFLLPLAGMGVVGIWWLRMRRVPMRTRMVWFAGAAACGLVGVLLAAKLTWLFVIMFGVPLAFAVLVLFAAIARIMGFHPTAAAFIVVGALAMVPSVVVRTNGQQGEGMMTFAWRWSRTDEEMAARRAEEAPTTRVAPADLVATTGDWPSFRGPGRDGIVAGVAFDLPANAAGFKPRQLWQRRVGRGWSSFAVVGNVAFTQQQLESKECVVCYDIRDGRQLWLHSDDNRFEEMSGGPGPRATPAVAAGRVYSFGPTGLLNCLDAATGQVLWQITTYARATGRPQYGYAGSPIVEGDKVIIGPSGAGGVDLAAFDAATGKPLWTAAGGKAGYSSPVVGTLGGVRQVIFLDGDGLSGHALDDGKRLWSVGWSTNKPKSATPCIVDDSTVLIGMGYGFGLRLLKITHEGDRWSAAEKWHAKTINPKFNDLVCHDGYVYGLDEGVMACVSLADGSLRWRDGEYGYGQLLLAGSSFLVLAESGEVAVVAATPEKFTQLGRFNAIAGKTWNHPVLVRGKLLVRNSVEAACYDLSPWVGAGGSAK